MAFVAPLILAAGVGGGAAAAGGSLLTALSVGSAALGGLSAFQAGQYQAAVARNNARIAERNAGLEADRAQVEQLRADRETAELLGQQEALQAASGLDILGKSQLKTRKSTQRVGRETALDIRAEGTSRARGFLQDAADFRGEATQAKTQAYFSLAKGALEAGGAVSKDPKLKKSLLGAARSVRRRFD